jgi:hypothetical protein
MRNESKGRFGLLGWDVRVTTADCTIDRFSMPKHLYLSTSVLLEEKNEYEQICNKA